MLDIIWPETNSLALPHGSHPFRWDWLEPILILAYSKDSLSLLTTCNTHSDPLKHKHQYRHTLLNWSLTTDRFFCCCCFISLASSTPFHSFASAFNLSLSPSTFSPRLLFLTTGHYELPALTPGNYGNSFLLDYRRPVGRLHHNNQVCAHARARAVCTRSFNKAHLRTFLHSLSALSPSSPHIQLQNAADLESSVALNHSLNMPLCPHKHTRQWAIHQYKWVQRNVIKRWIKAQYIHLAAISGVYDIQPEQLLVATWIAVFNTKDRISWLFGKCSCHINASASRLFVSLQLFFPPPTASLISLMLFRNN